MRGKDGIADSKFIYYFLTQNHIADLLHAVAEDSTSTYPAIRPEEIVGLELDLPPVTEQPAIAHILGTLDDKIELNRRMNQTLEEMARALFKSWFVDFDPVRAKAALKQHPLRNHAHADAEPKGIGTAPAAQWTVERAHAYLDAMDPQIVDFFPHRLVPSGLGRFQKGGRSRPWENSPRIPSMIIQKPQRPNPSGRSSYASPASTIRHGSSGIRFLIAKL